MSSTFRRSLAAGRCIGRKDYKGAIDSLREILERDPHDLWAQSMLAQCFAWDDEYSDALEAATCVLETNPNDPLCLRIAARAAVQLSQHHRAKGYVKRSLIYQAEYSNGVLRLLVRILRFGTFVPIVGRMHRRLRQSLARIESSNQSWNDWARKYLDWYQSTFE